MNPTPPPHLKRDERNLWYDALRVIFGNCAKRPPVEARHLGLVYVEAKGDSRAR